MLNFIKYSSHDDRLHGETQRKIAENFAEKFLLFLAVSPRNKQFTVCLFLPEARNLFFLAHLSQRLTGELIGYPWIRRPSSVVVVRPFTFSNIFSSGTAWPIKAKFYVESPREGGTKVYINSPGHMTKMAAMPIYGKKLKNSTYPEPEVL